MNKQQEVKKGFLLAFGEIFLKSEGVQRILRRRLINNLTFFLKKEKVDFKISSWRERIFVETIAEDTSEVEGKLRRTFGLAWLAKAFFLKNADLKDLHNFVKENYQDWMKKGESFALRVKRGGIVQETREEIIKKIAEKIDRKVDLDNPKREIFLEGRKNGWFIYFKKQKGAGGFPVGSQGKVLCLLSGGIDSPVAAWLMAKRGAKNVWLHFHSFPLVSKASIEKTRELAETFLGYQPKLKVYFVPFSKIQTKIKTSIPPQNRVLLYRRLMLKIGQKIAAKEGCQALVTGESLGQVSSQTLANLPVTQDGIKTLILRPLIGMDKEEIILLAKKIKTYGISIQPQEDCCTLFVPKHQTAAGKIEIIKELEKSLEPSKLIAEAISQAKIESF